MRKILYSLSLILLITPFTLHAQSAERFFIPLPQILAKWKLGSHKELTNGSAAYYILDNETMETWTQLVRLQFKERIKLECTNAEQAVKKEALLNKGVVYKIHAQQENDVTFEKVFPTGLHELARMVMTEKGLYRIAYTRRDAPFMEIDRSMWLERLAKSRAD